MDERCVECIRRSHVRILEKYRLSDSGRIAFLKFFEDLMENKNGLSTLDAGQILRKQLMDVTGVRDPYAEEKLDGNKVAMDLYSYWKPRVMESSDPFNMALRLAVAGNIMDYGALSGFDIHQTITRVLDANFAIDHSEKLKRAINQARSLLYLGDNAGEIVFDRLLIETMGHADVTFVVRGAPVINDVTMEDALYVGIDKVARVIDSGYNAPSTIPDKAGQEFREAFARASVIISKGQGNLEGLWERRDDRIFFLLMAKCPVFAEYFSVEQQSFLCVNHDMLRTSKP